jgi:hypothetical protein
MSLEDKDFEARKTPLLAVVLYVDQNTIPVSRVVVNNFDNCTLQIVSISKTKIFAHLFAFTTVGLQFNKRKFTCVFRLTSIY